MDRKQHATACTSQHKEVPFRDLVMLREEVETKERKSFYCWRMVGGAAKSMDRTQISNPNTVSNPMIVKVLSTTFLQVRMFVC
jgi:hypothetical protein